jgi:chaperonin GroEL (HSP60 family)
VAVIRGDLKIRKMTRVAEIKITDADQLDSFIAAEQNRKEKIVQSVSQSGAKLVLCGGEVDRDILHNLTNSGILVVSELDSSEIEQAALATNAGVIDGVMDIDSETLGQCGSVEWVRKPPSDQVEDIITIDECPLAKLVTISVSGTSDTASEETIRCLHDAIRSLSACETNPNVVVGAGSIHARIAHGVRSASLNEPGRERLAMDAFARAMECIPFALASNAGAEGLDTVLEIRTKSRDEVEREYGVTEHGEVMEIDDVLHPSSAILSSIEAALETAVGMLRIDQVVSARGD